MEPGALRPPWHRAAGQVAPPPSLEQVPCQGTTAGKSGVAKPLQACCKAGYKAGGKARIQSAGRFGAHRTRLPTGMEKGNPVFSKKKALFFS